MAYAKKSFLLKSAGSKGKTVLTLETDSPISVSGAPLPEEAKLHAFYDEYNIYPIDDADLDITSVCAICVTDTEGRFILTGELQGDFDWEKAKSNHRLRYPVAEQAKPPVNVPDEIVEIEEPQPPSVMPYIPRIVEEQAQELSAPPVPPAPPASVNIEQEAKCPVGRQYTQVNPFPQAFDKSNWYKVDFPVSGGSWHYIIGEIYKDGAIDMRAVGVPGEYAQSAPGWLEGFNTYMNADAGAKGYWMMFYK